VSSVVYGSDGGAPGTAGDDLAGVADEVLPRGPLDLGSGSPTAPLLAGSGWLGAATAISWGLLLLRRRRHDDDQDEDA
jgi:hypothetical protein